MRSTIAPIIVFVFGCAGFLSSCKRDPAAAPQNKIAQLAQPDTAIMSEELERGRFIAKDPGSGHDIIWFANSLIGHGYDLMKGIEKGQVLDERKMLLKKPGGENEGSIVNFSCGRITSYNSLRETLGIDANASFQIGLGVSGAASYFKEEHYNSFDEYIYFQVIVVNPKEILETSELRGSALAYANKGVITFYENCGDRFLIARRTGGRFFAVARISCSSSEEKQQVGVALQASGLFGSGKVTFKNAVEQLSKNYSLEMKMYQEGGEGSLPSLEQLQDYALAFPDQAKAHPTTLCLYAAPYNSVSNLPSNLQNPGQVNNKISQLGILAEYYERIIQIRNDLHHIKAHPERFEIEGDFNVEAANQKNEADMREVENVAQRCRNSDANFEMPKLPTFVAVKARLKPPKKPDNTTHGGGTVVTIPVVQITKLKLTWRSQNSNGSESVRCTIVRDDKATNVGNTYYTLGPRGAGLLQSMEFPNVGAQAPAKFYLSLSTEGAPNKGILSIVAELSNGRQKTLLDELVLAPPNSIWEGYPANRPTSLIVPLKWDGSSD